MVLTWTRATAPDSFAIERDGVFVDTDLLPGDLLVSGTTYQYVDKSAPPNWDLTYRVRAKDSGKLSPGNTVNATLSVGDVWLIDPDHAATRLVPVKVLLTDCTFNMPEVSATYQPVDGSAPVVWTQGLQGLAGTIQGRVYAVPNSSVTAEAAVADLLWFKTHPDYTVRMTIGNQNIHVRLSAVDISPLAVRDTNAREVSFNFASLDGPKQ
jgi:hypothetical protein